MKRKAKFKELDVVELKKEFVIDEGTSVYVLPKGSQGTIVEVYGSAKTFLVEFIEVPVVAGNILVCIKANGIELADDVISTATKASTSTNYYQPKA